MIGQPPFPINPRQLTTEFLAGALGENVASFESTIIGADRGMLGEVALLDVRTTDDRDLKPMVAKFATSRAGSRDSSRRGGVHLRELSFYDVVAPRTPVRVPHVHGAWYDEVTDDFLLLQEAIEVDLHLDQLAGIDPERVASVVSEIGGCHATWWEAPELEEFDWLPSLAGPARRTNLATIAQQGWEPLCAMLGDELSAEERALGPGLPDVLDRRLCDAASRTSTLIHSDLRVDNLLFTPGTTTVTIIDWQGCGIGPGAWDLAYLISQGLTVDDRRAHEDRLIDTYLKLLEGHGVRTSREEIVDDYELSLIFGLVVAVSLPLVGNPSEPRTRELAATMARRSIDAMRDHEVLW